MVALFLVFPCFVFVFFPLFGMLRSFVFRRPEFFAEARSPERHSFCYPAPVVYLSPPAIMPDGSPNYDCFPIHPPAMWGVLPPTLVWSYRLH